MLNVKENTDIHAFANQLQDHLGAEFWVLVENKPPAAKAHFKSFEENNFKLPNDLELFYRDTNGTSLTWGENAQLHSKLGHFQIVRLELIRELGNDLYSLNNCDCCPKLGFDSDGKIFVNDRRGDWCFITDSIFKFFRLALYYGASIGWPLLYSPLGVSDKTKETILFNFVSKLQLPEPQEDNEDDPYPFKPTERSRIEQILDRKNEKRTEKSARRILKR